eukprot:4822222-Pleurochrysis_carterae.AAC.1
MLLSWHLELALNEKQNNSDGRVQFGYCTWKRVFRDAWVRERRRVGVSTSKRARGRVYFKTGTRVCERARGAHSRSVGGRAWRDAGLEHRAERRDELYVELACAD